MVSDLKVRFGTAVYTSEAGLVQIWEASELQVITKGPQCDRTFHNLGHFCAFGRIQV